MAADLSKLEPQILWKHFDALRKIPRCSGHEEKAAAYVMETAKKLGLAYRQDDAGNVVVQKPATPGKENAEGVVLQTHLDMVCEKNSDVNFDFSQDAIQVRQEGDWLYANGTTLGADNGIGIAAALAVMESTDLVHGPMEFLFTVEEEIGLLGAGKLPADFLQYRKMLNLDSEEEGIFFIGCAGGADTTFRLSMQTKSPAGDLAMKIRVSGFHGGHSGIDIDKNRGNAIKFLTRMLWNAMDAGIPLELADFSGGNKRNAIPREAEAVVVLEKGKEDTFRKTIEKAFHDAHLEYTSVEKEANFSAETLDQLPDSVLTVEETARLLNVLYSIPHGVLKMSSDIPDLVETSMNLATIRRDGNLFEVGISSRSSINSALESTRQQLRALGALAGAEVEQPPGYPGWTPNLDSDILKTVKKVYKNLYGKEPGIKAIHAGLECGIIGEKFPGMDMISIGPQIEHPHSPNERVHIPSVARFWDFLKALLEELAS